MFGLTLLIDAPQRKRLLIDLCQFEQFSKLHIWPIGFTTQSQINITKLRFHCFQHDDNGKHINLQIIVVNTTNYFQRESKTF